MQGSRLGWNRPAAEAKFIGAPKGISKKNQQKAVLCEGYFKEGKFTVSEISKRLDISRATYYKYLRHRGMSEELRGCFEIYHFIIRKYLIKFRKQWED
jgi:response regulator of citrate/malate metabolism